MALVPPMSLPAPLIRTPVAQRLVSIANGAFGERGGDMLPAAMSVRRQHRRVALDTVSLAAAFPAATGRIAVFVHGLLDTERSWFRRGGSDFGSRLAADLQCTPVFVRHNSGRRIAHNGSELADLLATLVDQWPVDVTEIVLVGHSLGGLVVRSALHQAHERARSWAALTRAVVCLGSPHGGAPLERMVARTASVLERNRLAAPLSWLLALRSDGIKDLADGALHADPDGRPCDPVLPPGVRQLFVAATVSRSENGVLAGLLGDLIVHPSSVRDGAADADVRWLGGIDHFALQRHDTVYETIVDWLRTARLTGPSARRRRAA